MITKSTEFMRTGKNLALILANYCVVVIQKKQSEQ